MSVWEEVVRLAAKGDGVTGSGRHIAGAAPGDVILDDGSVIGGPHRATPPCRHFGRCGGCLLQHCDERALEQFVTDRVLNAAASQQLKPARVLPTHLSPARSRRRATLHAMATGGKVAIGFKEKGTHRIVDMRECHVLDPALFALVQPLRHLLGKHIARASVDVSLSLSDQGVDCLINGLQADGLSLQQDLLTFAAEHGIARLTMDRGFGAEAVWEPEPVTITFARISVALPPGGFLQATQDGERVLQGDVADFLAGAGRVLDLFAGLGTLSLPLSRNGVSVMAVEADRAAHFACRSALFRQSGGNAAVHRDLFRSPLQPGELVGFDGVIIDPPRAGARAQMESLAASDVPGIAYVSCNPASWARDARMLTDRGYRLEAVRPVGQFRWSTHVELTSLFVRQA